MYSIVSEFPITGSIDVSYWRQTGRCDHYSKGVKVGDKGGKKDRARKQKQTAAKKQAKVQVMKEKNQNDPNQSGIKSLLGSAGAKKRG